MTSFQKWLLLLSTLLVTLSGLVYGALKYFGERLSRTLPFLSATTDDPFSVVHHPIQSWALHLHVLAAPVLVFAIGWIFKDHVVAKLAAKGTPVRRSGVLGLALIGPMILSGYLLQTLTNEGLRLGTVFVHTGTGLLYAGVYALHVRLAPRRNGT